ncbi:LuxR family two component transcriptional regulator [Brevibacterium sanguinis]|uniref:LuxR family two component transcriptional regulator n=2 Tax=Brevibacterium TaxID=1696 RepID=A0A366IML0_9MICO|nr:MULTISPECIES: response regulator transcription factor [Brevibacterium]RBP66075.1 LuxR family two component transcriptional regulator [Brevibacterium sanguinis]RBP72726.1 LuxR family two component transcriptional regulator [Brevibacterium celere]
MPHSNASIRVLLVDDDSMVLTGIQAILAGFEDIEIVGCAHDGEGALEQTALHFPDVVLMDVRMPGIGGIEATARIVNGVRAPKVISLTSFDSDDCLFQALEAGASGFLLKDVGPTDLAEAIRIVHRGENILAPRATQRIIRSFVAKQDRRAHREAVDLAATLTAREREIAVLVAQGLSNREIAEATYSSEATVKTHLARVGAKLDANNRVRIAVIVERSGLQIVSG